MHINPAKAWHLLIHKLKRAGPPPEPGIRYDLSEEGKKPNMAAFVLVHCIIKDGVHVETKCRWLYRWGDKAETEVEEALKDGLGGLTEYPTASSLIVREYLDNMVHWS